MAKQKKKSFGIKTTRYFTKTCSQCKFEYPNWFTNCPKCGASWDFNKTENLVDEEDQSKKNIKIVVKITEEDFDKSLKQVRLVFSADQGKSWYQMQMENKQDYFLAEIADVPTGITIIYYIQVYLERGEIITENNEGRYFFYKVGIPIEFTEKEDKARLPEIPSYENYQPQKVNNTYSEFNEPKNNLLQEKEFYTPKQEKIYISNPDFKSEKKSIPIKIQPPDSPEEYHFNKNRTIFGLPQVEIDPELKTCPYCNSKIKKMWSICPICGKSL